MEVSIFIAVMFGGDAYETTYHASRMDGERAGTFERMTRTLSCYVTCTISSRKPGANA
jgi:hypothetical protein